MFFPIKDHTVTRITRVIDSLNYRQIIIDESLTERSSREVRVLFVSQATAKTGGSPA